MEDPLVWLAIAALVLVVLFLPKRRGNRRRRPPRGPTPASGRGAAFTTRGLYAPAKPYPGDYFGRVDVVYDPHPDGVADPGEIVWTWVPYQEDHTKGKDRPVLLIAHHGEDFLGLMLTSKDHVQGAERGGRYIDIGVGPWDNRGRPSEVKLDRIVHVDAAAIRRQGAILPAATFEQVRRSLYALHDW